MFAWLASAYFWKQLGSLVAMLSGGFGVLAETHSDGEGGNADKSRSKHALNTKGKLALAGVILGGIVSVVAQRQEHVDSIRQDAERRRSDSLAIERTVKLSDLARENLGKLDTLRTRAETDTKTLANTRQSGERAILKLNHIAERASTIVELQGAAIKATDDVAQRLARSVEIQAGLSKEQRQTIQNTERLLSGLTNVIGRMDVTFRADSGPLARYAERVRSKAAGFRRRAENNEYYTENDEIAFDDAGEVREVWIKTLKSAMAPAAVDGDAISWLTRGRVDIKGFRRPPKFWADTAKSYEIVFFATLPRDEAERRAQEQGEENFNQSLWIKLTFEQGTIPVVEQFFSARAIVATAGGDVFTLKDVPDKHWLVLFGSFFGPQPATVKFLGYSVSPGLRTIELCPGKLKTVKLPLESRGNAYPFFLYETDARDVGGSDLRTDCPKPPST